MAAYVNRDSNSSVPWWQPVLFAAMAGGMGWGIRGQYGHETGAMIAGLLVCLTLVFLLCPRPASFSVVRAVAFGTVAMGFGGTMTYGQTLGLTQNAPLIGNWGALSWGMLGCAIKGGIWIGFAGAFLGMGLGGVRYRPREILGLMLAAIGAYYIGVRLLNFPFYPAEQRLPLLYFSESWRWQPDGDLSPRREAWGGLLFALITVVVYFGSWRKDKLARNLALWGILGGAIGFPLGQSLQAFHAWNPEVFQEGFWTNLDPYMNWWNMMEITFGATMGAMLGLGLWLNRKKIAYDPEATGGDIREPVEWILIAVHVALLAAVDFLAIPSVDALYDFGLIMGIIPMVAIAGGRWWPYLLIMPITLMPIAGKTVRQLVYKEEVIGVIPGWIVYFGIPMLIATIFAVASALRYRSGRREDYVLPSLLVATWMYFLLNYAFFHFPWPWSEWTGRTPSGIIFTVCTLGLSALVVLKGMKRRDRL